MDQTDKADQGDSTSAEATAESVSKPPAAPTTPPSPSDGSGAGSGGVDDHKVMAIVGYIVTFLFFIPLLSEAKHNAFAKHHANQQLNLLLLWVVGQVASGALAFVIIGIFLLPLVVIAGVILMIMGIINATQGNMKSLPVIGKLQLIK